jgi:hypothetical protein
MNYDLDKILASKEAMRRRLMALPVGEKLSILDALRERELTIRKKAACLDPRAHREEAASPGVQTSALALPGEPSPAKS